jgi:hypothetical protein
MSVPSVGSATPQGSVPPVQPSAVNARAADGDYVTKGPGRSTVKDADGDYRRASAQTTTSASAQSALANLKLGGS